VVRPAPSDDSDGALKRNFLAAFGLPPPPAPAAPV
jgi:hypothetical protein